MTTLILWCAGVALVCAAAVAYLCRANHRVTRSRQRLDAAMIVAEAEAKRRWRHHLTDDPFAFSDAEVDVIIAQVFGMDPTQMRAEARRQNREEFGRVAKKDGEKP